MRERQVEFCTRTVVGLCASTLCKCSGVTQFPGWNILAVLAHACSSRNPTDFDVLAWVDHVKCDIAERFIGGIDHVLVWIWSFFSCEFVFLFVPRRYFLRLPEPQVPKDPCEIQTQKISSCFRMGAPRLLQEFILGMCLAFGSWCVVVVSCQRSFFLASRLGTEADTGDDRAISVLIDMLADKDPDFRIGALRV